VFFPPFCSSSPKRRGISRHGVVENVLWDHGNVTTCSSARHRTARKWQLTWSSMQLDRYATTCGLAQTWYHVQICYLVQLIKTKFWLKTFEFIFLWEFYLRMSWEDVWRFYCCSEYGMLPTSV